jgi:signal transduction histidine kinase
MGRSVGKVGGSLPGLTAKEVMRRFRDTSIRHKVVIVVLLASFLALGLTMISLLSYEAVTFRAAALRILTAEADVIDPERASLALHSLSVNPQITAACIYTADNKIFSTYRRSGYANYQFPPPEPDGSRITENSVLLFHSVYSGNEKIGQLFLRYDFGSHWAALPRYSAIFVGIAAVLLVAAFLFASFLQRLITDPILNLSKTARKVKEKNDFSLRAPVPSNDECGELAATFNEMLQTIESRDRSLQHELTERRRVEEALQRSKDELAHYANELEHRVDERTSSLRENITFLEGFCYSIAHDLRAPLRSMAGFSRALADDYGPRLDEQGQEFARRIIDSATRMDKLIADLLVFGKLSQVDLTFAPLNLNHATEKVLSLLEDEVKAKKAQIRLETTDLTIWANSTVFEQVLGNLIVNALKFAKHGVAPTVEVGAKVKDHTVHIYVKDNGIGIAPAHHERIFRVFERLHTEKEYTGTGIGLALVKKGIERMKGRVWVESTQGEGSVFWIELPSEEIAAA